MQPIESIISFNTYESYSELPSNKGRIRILPFSTRIRNSGFHMKLFCTCNVRLLTFGAVVRLDHLLAGAKILFQPLCPSLSHSITFQSITLSVPRGVTVFLLILVESLYQFKTSTLVKILCERYFFYISYFFLSSLFSLLILLNFCSPLMASIL